MNKSINISNIPKRDVAIKANHIVYINCQPSVANISIKTKIRDIIDVKKNKKESNIILSIHPFLVQRTAVAMRKPLP